MQLRGCQVELPTFGGAQRGRIHAVGEWTVRSEKPMAWRSSYEVTPLQAALLRRSPRQIVRAPSPPRGLETPIGPAKEMEALEMPSLEDMDMIAQI
eukprot:symbB.v1.2.034311.t1/scaffold4408.1/size40047/1